jgi:hypothetical protein
MADACGADGCWHDSVVCDCSRMDEDLTRLTLGGGGMTGGFSFRGEGLAEGQRKKEQGDSFLSSRLVKMEVASSGPHRRSLWSDGSHRLSSAGR